MAELDIEIGGRRYALACRDGEEDHLRRIAATVDDRAKQAAGAMGGLNEVRQFLFASLLLADELEDLRNKPAPAAPATPVATDNPALATALERLADRIEALVAGQDGGRAETVGVEIDTANP